MTSIRLIRRMSRWIGKSLDSEKIQLQEDLFQMPNQAPVSIAKLSGFDQTLSDVLAEIAVLTVDVTAFLPPG